MVYKLKKHLTKEDLIKTFWDDLDDDKIEFMLSLIKKFNLFYFRNYRKLYVDCKSLSFQILPGLYRKKKFDDYFAELRGIKSYLLFVDEAENISDKDWEDVVGIVEKYKFGIGAQINKCHKEGEVRFLDNIEFLNLSLVPNPPKGCEFKGELIEEFKTPFEKQLDDFVSDVVDLSEIQCHESDFLEKMKRLCEAHKKEFDKIRKT